QFVLSSPPSDYCHCTLEPNTAHRNLHLSEGNRRVKRRAEVQSYPDHPERFDVWTQVLCREGVSGRCYWEVEWRGCVFISVSNKSISRKGEGVECVCMTEYCMYLYVITEYVC